MRSAVALGSIILLIGCTMSEATSSPTESTTTVASTTSSTVTTSSPAMSTTTTTSTTQPCSRTEPTRETHQYKVIDGVHPDLLSLDAHRPANCDLQPALIWVHGGSWSQGDKFNQPMITKANWAHSQGWVLVSVNYRLTQGRQPARWPDHGHDVADALAWVVDNHAEIGVDPDRVALLGHSAGGHLVSIITTDPAFLADRGLDTSTIDCTVSLDGVGYRLDASSMVSNSLITEVFGNDPNVRADASPSVQVERNGAPGGRILIVTRGSAANTEAATAFVSLVQSVGGSVELLDVGDYSHNRVNAFLGRTDETRLTPPVTEFLNRCLDATD